MIAHDFRAPHFQGKLKFYQTGKMIKLTLTNFNHSSATSLLILWLTSTGS